MPALTVFRCGKNGRGFTTRPFAGDDLQVVCALFGVYRVIQLACILPFWVKLFLYRLYGKSFIGPDDMPSWCLNANTLQEHNGEEDAARQAKTMAIPFGLFLVISLLYTILDMGLSFAIWSAASVGTPCEPRGRDNALRSLILVKIIFMNLMIFLVLGSGVYLVMEGRKYNYGCGPEGDEVTIRFENSSWYTMFSLTMVTYAIEFLLWPCILTNQISSSIVYQYRQSTILENILFNNRQKDRRDKRDRNTEACLGWCFGFLRCLSCNRLGGGNIRAQSDLKDAAVTIMEFFNTETSFDLVLSDIYLCFKLLGRLNRARKYKLALQARRDEQERKSSLRRIQETALQDNTSLLGEEGGLGETKSHVMGESDNHLEASIPDALRDFSELRSLGDHNESFNFHKDHNDISKKQLLRHTESDLRHIREAARYSHFALGVYDIYPGALMATGRMDGGLKGIYSPSENEHEKSKLSLSSFYRLDELGFEDVLIIFASFHNDILATPYAILVDEKEKSVVVSIRGTASLEDLVTDLQLSAVSMESVREVCKIYSPVEYYSHRGMLTKCKWIYNDICRRNILPRLLPGNGDATHGACHGYKLIITGHSLGAGCAAILGTMFRPKYPHLHCYAYEPPGCCTSVYLSKECEEYVTSIVVGNDIIPRVRIQNFEILRYECLLLLARVKIPKLYAWRDLRTPCTNRDLESRNKRLLHDKEKIPNTEYYEDLASFAEKRLKMMNERFPPHNRLCIPGRIIHLVQKDKKNLKYLPYWECREAFHELTLNADAVGEHNMDNLVIILENIAVAYSSSSEDSDGDDGLSCGSSDTGNVDMIYSQVESTLDARWFILCSKPPRGNVTFIPTFLALGGACCSIVGNNLCALFFRDVIDIGDTQVNSMNNTEDVIRGVTLGLYNYGVQYYSAELGDDFLLCFSHFPTTADPYIALARAFSALALCIGIPIVIILMFANCMKFSDVAFRRISLALLVVACFQALIFLFMKSDRCNIHPDVMSTELEFDRCYLDRGSKLAIFASIFWFMAAIFTLFIDEATIVETKLTALLMHLKSMG